MRRFVLSGALAGAAAAFAFTALHHLVISDIWFSLPLMLMAGAICGLCLAWTYGRLVRLPDGRSWWAYNLLFVLLFAVLGVVSVLLFEPITTVAEVLARGGRPDALIDRALPLNVAYVPASAAIVWLAFGRSRRMLDVLAILVTCVVLVALLGLNLSLLGLVEIPMGAMYLVAELFGLTLFLSAAYAGVFQMLERRTLRRRD